MKTAKSTISCRSIIRSAVFAAALIPCTAFSPHARAQCNCNCDAIVPTGQQINGSQMNEDGSGPTHHVSAGSPSGAAREIRHGNLFAGGMTITHVCIALQSPSGQPGEMANIQFYQPDPDPLAMNLPGTMTYNQQFQISPDFNGHQIVQLTTPQSPANYWLVVAYPTAQPAVGHQGTRPRTQGNSAVFIAGPPDPAAPGWVPNKWTYYDDMGGPGGTAGYYLAAPIIRPLNIGASSSACPHGPACCSAVCAMQPSCCAVWDPICDQIALQQCFPTGCAACPPGSATEGEACNTDINGGCDTNGIFSNLNCDTTICGTLWRTNALIDTDWYVIDVVDVDGSGMSFFTIDIESELAITVTLQNDACPFDPQHVTFSSVNTQACVIKTLYAAVPSPGRYRISVRPLGMSPLCPNESRYTLAVDVDDCGPGVPAPGNNDCANATSYLVLPGAATFDTTGATTDGPAEPCGFTGLNDADVWFIFIAPCGGTATMSLVGQVDRLLAAYTDCPPPQGPGLLLGCGAGAGPAPATITFSTVAGQVYFIRAGGQNGAQGIMTLQVDFQTCYADINRDCRVDVNEILIVINHWGRCPNPCPPYCLGDVNQDCQVGLGDLLAVINHWGPCP